MSKAVRVLLDEEPFKYLNNKQEPDARGTWPANWVYCSNTNEEQLVAAYKLHFNVAEKSDIRIHVTADERYELFLDGQRIGRGPERGDVANWFFESFDLRLSAGSHIIIARVWSLGKLAPQAQVSLRHGLLVAAEEPFSKLMNTGLAQWKTKQLEGYTFSFNEISWGAGPDIFLDENKIDWNFLQEIEEWSEVLSGEPGVNASGFADYSIKGHLLRPAMLPPMLSRECRLGKVCFIDEPECAETWRYPASDNTCNNETVLEWNNLLRGNKIVSMPAYKRQRIIIDLDDYYCAYPRIVISEGTGAFLRIHWAESLYEKSCPEQLDNPKGQRDVIEDKYFIGVGDSLKSGGGTRRIYKPLWWRAGRYVEIFIETASEPLVIESLAFEETGYPLSMESSFDSSEARISKIFPIMVRVMQRCSHETFVDCPYYEQLMYAGDSRLTSLVGYCMTNDDSLARKAIEMFDISRLPSNFTRSQYPSRVTQIIPPFSLLWVGMVYDYAMWRGDKEFIKRKMPGVRGVIDAFVRQRNQAGFVVSPVGWNFMDWVPEWERGVPPDGENGVSGLINWQFVYVLKMVAELERWLGENELSARMNRIGGELATGLIAKFWDSERTLFADDLNKQNFSEHTQCMALLSGFLDEKMREKIANSRCVQVF
jgi:hypothetical protein